MRTVQAQLQDLADWSSGLPLTCLPELEDFAEGPLREAWRAIRGQEYSGDELRYQQECYARLRNAMIGDPEGARLLARIGRIIPSDKRPFISLEELATDLPPIQWLWHKWLARGMVGTFNARPGAGKSMVCLDLAGRVMTAAPWPDGQPASQPPAPVIYVDGENIPQVHNARALAWGLPRSSLYLLLPQGDDVLVDLSTTKYQELLMQMVYRLEPALVIVDSLGAVLGKGENAVEDVRGVMGFLASLAHEQNSAVVAVHHLRKALPGQTSPSDTIDMDQMRGSGHIAAMSRISIGLAPVRTDPRSDANALRKLQVIKSNIAAHPTPLGVRLEPLADGEQVRVAYDLTVPTPYEEPAKRDLAAEWLVETLRAAGGPLTVKTLVTAGREAGFSRSALYRARQSLAGQVLSEGERENSEAEWRLAESSFHRFIVSSSQAVVDEPPGEEPLKR